MGGSTIIPSTGSANTTVVWLAVGLLAVGIGTTRIAQRRYSNR